MLAAQHDVKNGYRVVVDIDLSQVFDRINHDILYRPFKQTWG
ncbi:hypothetical protein [Massilia sp. S19_KUP03_FR1]